MSARVLLVDDDVSNRITLAALLEDDGFSVDQAASFAEASAALEAAATPYDLVLLDQNLGDGMGTNLVPAIRARMPAAGIVLISGSIDDEDRALAACDAMVPKGTIYPEILATLNRVTSRG